MNPTPAPIHDIAPPVPFFPYPTWIVIAVVLGILGLLVCIIWSVKKYFLKKEKIPPIEVALTALNSVYSRINTISPYDFGIEVSAILRRYVQEEYGFSATTQTSLEFLESIRTNDIFSPEEKTMLGAFLETADLLKFARAKVGVDESHSLLQQAQELIRIRKNIPSQLNISTV